jgi:DNA recombination protein RmuC
VVDSKVSLTAYTEFVSAETDQQRDLALKQHLDSVKKHVKELSEKNYSELLGINSPDFVLMFMPIEPAFGVAVQADHDLFNYAWKRKVVIVSPTTLLATLRTIASIWKYEKQSQNAQEIARRGGLLYDKFVSFISDLEKVGKGLDNAQKAFNDAHKKLTSGRGDLITQAEQLKTMGVPTKKSLPADYLETGEE